jgi:hypothetical protein
MNILNLLSGIPAAAATYFTRKMELKAEERQQAQAIKKALVERQLELIREGMHADASWELEQIKNSGYKDEWVLFLLSIPLILVFIPKTAPYVMEGFKILEQTPDWYRWLVMLIFTAIYGIRIWRRQQTDTP